VTIQVKSKLEELTNYFPQQLLKSIMTIKIKKQLTNNLIVFYKMINIQI